jgi:hypothetical protein
MVNAPSPSYADARRRRRLTADLPPVRQSTWMRLTALSFPRRFPIVQFPNLPLIVAFLASQAGRVLSTAETPYARSISYLAMTIWAYEELIDGVNWFRRLLGLTYAVVTIVRVAHAVMHG